MSLRVYLAGPITGLSYAGATDWREYVERELSEYGVVCASPMRGKDFILKRIGTGEVLAQTYEDAPMNAQKGIVARDRFDISHADVVLLNLLGADRVSIGSMVEVGWCDAFRKVLVLVMEPTGNPHDHAFPREVAGYRVPTLDNAIELISVLAKPYGVPRLGLSFVGGGV